MITIMSMFMSLIQSLGLDTLNLAAGETLFHAGQSVERLYVIDEGEVALERVSPDGHRLIMQRAKAGDILAEASVFASIYHCDAISLSATRLSSVLMARVKSAQQTDPRFMEALAQHLAAQVQQARLLSELLLLRKVSDRLDAWLNLHGAKLPVKGAWRQIAAEIGVTPEALYREIAKRSDGSMLGVRK